MEVRLLLNHGVKRDCSQRRLDGVMVVSHHVQDPLPWIGKTRLDPVAEQDPVGVRLDGSLSVRAGQSGLDDEDDRPHSSLSFLPVARDLHEHLNARVLIANPLWPKKKVQGPLAVAHLGLGVEVGRLGGHDSQAVRPLGVGPEPETLFGVPGMNP